MKACISCLNMKPIKEYYTHIMMADGHLNKCKQCCKNQATKRRQEKIDEIRAFDRSRTRNYDSEKKKKYYRKYKLLSKAKQAINNGLRNGTVIRNPYCETCGKPSENAHHDDYMKPFDVRWLCAVCHSQWHRDNGSGLNRLI